MGKINNMQARRYRDTLRVLMGGACQDCGRPDRLEFHVIVPQGHDHHRSGFEGRMRFYRRQYAIGNLALLCADCHRKFEAERWNQFRLLFTAVKNNLPALDAARVRSQQLVERELESRKLSPPSDRE